MNKCVVLALLQLTARCLSGLNPPRSSTNFPHLSLENDHMGPTIFRAK